MVAMGLYLIGFKQICNLSLCKLEVYIYLIFKRIIVHFLNNWFKAFRFIYSNILFAIYMLSFITVNLASYVLFIRQKKRKKCVTKFMDQGLSLFTEEGILVLLILQTSMFTFLGDQTWNWVCYSKDLK